MNSKIVFNSSPIINLSKIDKLDLIEKLFVNIFIPYAVYLIVLDETDARNIADIYNINKTGFIGILLKANKNGLINNFKELLDKAILKGFWINKILYKQIISACNH